MAGELAANETETATEASVATTTRNARERIRRLGICGRLQGEMDQPERAPWLQGVVTRSNKSTRAYRDEPSRPVARPSPDLTSEAAWAIFANRLAKIPQTIS